METVNIFHLKINNCFLDYFFKSADQPLKFGEFIKLETPNKSIAQIIFIEWIKHARNGQKLNFDNEIVHKLLSIYYINFRKAFWPKRLT